MSTTRLHIQGEYAPNRKEIHNRVRAEAGEKCIRCGHADDVTTGHVLTVHHLNGNKADNYWGNLLALCQRCHLKIQGRVNPDTVYFLEHSDWFKPYAAAHYARKYLCESPTREETVSRMEELLKLERLV